MKGVGGNTRVRVTGGISPSPSPLPFLPFCCPGISLLSLVIQYLQERALPRSVTGAKDPTAPTQSEGGIDRFQLSNAPEVAVTLERHSLSPYRLTLTDGL